MTFCLSDFMRLVKIKPSSVLLFILNRDFKYICVVSEGCCCSPSAWESDSAALPLISCYSPCERRRLKSPKDVRFSVSCNSVCRRLGFSSSHLFHLNRVLTCGVWVSHFESCCALLQFTDRKGLRLSSFRRLIINILLKMCLILKPMSVYAFCRYYFIFTLWTYLWKLS